jgi:hypothetical protein
MVGFVDENPHMWVYSDVSRSTVAENPHMWILGEGWAVR